MTVLNKWSVWDVTIPYPKTANPTNERPNFEFQSLCKTLQDIRQIKWSKRSMCHVFMDSALAAVTLIRGAFSFFLLGIYR